MITSIADETVNIQTKFTKSLQNNEMNELTSFTTSFKELVFL